MSTLATPYAPNVAQLGLFARDLTKGTLNFQSVLPSTAEKGP